MRLFVISDTHGEIEAAARAFMQHEGIDMIVHLGDYIRDAKRLSSMLGIPVKAVRGNCDGAMTKAGSETVLDTEYGKILLTHGHMYSVYYDPLKLLLECREKGYRAAFFGHTHVAFTETDDGITLLNPGSLTNPRDGRGGSYAVADVTADRLDIDLVFPNEPKKKPKARGGYLRKIMNYSDGQ